MLKSRTGTQNAQRYGHKNANDKFGCGLDPHSRFATVK